MMSPSSTVHRIADLDCRVVGSDGASDLVCVLCHGYGASGDDLVGLAGEVFSIRPALQERVRFVFPEAPLLVEDAPFGGRAWWPINMLELQRAALRGDLEERFREEPPGLSSSRKKVLALLSDLSKTYSVPYSRFVIGGFSQGAMLATDLVFSLEEAPAGLVIFSGTLLAEERWRVRASARKGLVVMQTHGLADPILPYRRAEKLHELLNDAGCNVRFHAFAGGHGIDAQGIEMLADILEGSRGT